MPRRPEPPDETPLFALDATDPFSSADASLAFGPPPGYEAVYPAGVNASSLGGDGFADRADLYGGLEPPEVGGRGDEVERVEVVEVSRRYDDGDDAIGNTNSLFTKV